MLLGQHHRVARGRRCARATCRGQLHLRDGSSVADLRASHQRLSVRADGAGALLFTIPYVVVILIPSEQFVLPANSSVLALLPMQPFIAWVRAFERGEFGVSDYITPAQRELLVDFARIWEMFVRDPCVGRTWEVFSAVLRALVTDPETFDGQEDGGFAQLAMLSDWARNRFPVSLHGMLLPALCITDDDYRHLGLVRCCT